jgi:hypothetical protein
LSIETYISELTIQVTVVGKRDLEARRHNRHDSDVVIVDGDRHGRHGRHRHHKGVTVIGRSHDDSEVGVDGEGAMVEGESEPHLAKRRKSRVIVVDGSRRWRDTDVYYHSYRHGRPVYFGNGDRFSRVRMIDNYGDIYKRDAHEYEEEQDDGLRKRSHDDRHDRHDRHGRHGRHGHSKRADIDMGGAPGYIDVTSPVSNSTTAQRIASLVLSTSNGTDTNSTFVLNASNNIRTQVFLVPVDETDKSEGPIAVNLRLPIFVAASAKVEQYCATFDPSPSAPSPLTVTPCVNGTIDSHQSQQFLYDPTTSVIHPDWQPSPKAQSVLDTVDDSVDDDEDASAMTASTDAADAEEDEDEAITPASAVSSGTSVEAEDAAPPALPTGGVKTPTTSDSFDSSASNVTLVFTPVNSSLMSSASATDDTEDLDTGDSDNTAATPSSAQLAARSKDDQDEVEDGDEDTESPEPRAFKERAEVSQ